MTFQVEKKTREATTRCPRNLACLSESPEQLCEVMAAVDGGGCFVVRCRDGICPYLGEEEGREVCTCPTRIRILQRYGI